MLDISLGAMLIELGIFLSTLILLNVFLFKPLLEFMDKRDKKLQEEKEKIAMYNDDASQYEDEIKSILEEARKKAREIVETAVKEAKETADKKVAVKVDEIEALKKDFNLSLSKEREELEKALASKISSIQPILNKKMKELA